MPFSVRLFRRFPIQCAVTYNVGPFQEQGTLWNLSCTGWRLSGDLPMRPRERLSLTVTLSNEQCICIEVPEAVVRGVERGRGSRPCTPQRSHHSNHPILNGYPGLAHTPSEDGGELIDDEHVASADAHDPHLGRIACVRRRRPIAEDRQDTNERKASGEGGATR